MKLNLFFISVLCLTVVIASGAEREPKPKQEDGLPTLLINPVEVDMEGSPAAGRLVKDQLPEYYGTDVYHMVYMPKNYKIGANYPVIVEITGNYYPASGSTGRVEDAHLGMRHL